jgi:hypothetical protein
MKLNLECSYETEQHILDTYVGKQLTYAATDV